MGARVNVCVNRCESPVCVLSYTGMALFAFFHLTVAYLGGEAEMLEKMQAVDCTLHVGPCCCCCFCLPSTPMDRWGGAFAVTLHHDPNMFGCVRRLTPA